MAIQFDYMHTMSECWNVSEDTNNLIEKLEKQSKNISLISGLLKSYDLSDDILSELSYDLDLLHIKGVTKAVRRDTTVYNCKHNLHINMSYKNFKRYDCDFIHMLGKNMYGNERIITHISSLCNKLNLNVNTMNYISSDLCKMYLSSCYAINNRNYKDLQEDIRKIRGIFYKISSVFKDKQKLSCQYITHKQFSMLPFVTQMDVKKLSISSRVAQEASYYYRCMIDKDTDIKYIAEQQASTAFTSVKEDTKVLVLEDSSNITKESLLNWLQCDAKFIFIKDTEDEKMKKYLKSKEFEMLIRNFKIMNLNLKVFGKCYLMIQN